MSKILNADITIVGAGLVGLSAAVAMHQAGFEVLLVDNQLPVENAGVAESDLDWDQRIYAISPKNAQWLTSLGAWQLLDKARIGVMQAMEIWGDETPTPLSLCAEDVNAEDLGFILEERALKAALLHCLQVEGVATLFGNSGSVLMSTPERKILQLENGQSIETKLLIAADGVNSWVRQQLGVDVEQKPYQQTAIVANFITEKSHHNIARQWFRQEGAAQTGADHCGILAWLPLPGNKISIVWSAPAAYADALLKLDDSAFIEEVKQAGGAALGQLTMLGTRAAFPLTLKKAEAFVCHNVILAGDAAHRIHPMAGQGVNLGFRDIVDLVAILSSRHAHQPINDAGLLRCYERTRKADLSTMLLLTNGLYHLFENQNPVLRKVRNWGLAIADKQLIRNLLVKQAIML